MDSLGCPSGMATDKVFMVQGGTHCGSSLVLFWALVIPVLCLRVLLTILNVRIALHVMKNRKEAKRSARRERIPITAVLEIVYTLIIIAGWPLWGFNIANAESGLGPAVFAIACFPNHFAMLPSSLKLVHLGDRVIPKAIRNHLATLSEGHPRLEKGLNSVRADPILFVLFFVLGSCIFLQPLFQAIFTTTIRPGTSNLWNQVGMGIAGGCCIAGGAIIYRQTFRVVNYIENVHAEEMKILKGTTREGAPEHTSDKALHRTVLALKHRALSFILSTFSSAVIYFCAAIIAMPWYVAFIILVVGQVAIAGSILLYKPTSMPICCFSGPFSSGSNKSQNISAPSSSKSNNVAADRINTMTTERPQRIPEYPMPVPEILAKTNSIVPHENTES